MLEKMTSQIKKNLLDIEKLIKSHLIDSIDIQSELA